MILIAGALRKTSALLKLAEGHRAALAHASYTAAPAVVWPDSPSAEAIVNADPIQVL